MGRAPLDERRLCDVFNPTSVSSNQRAFPVGSGDLKDLSPLLLRTRLEGETLILETQVAALTWAQQCVPSAQEPLSQN